MYDFLTLKMLPLALALIKTKNCHLFWPTVSTMPFFNGKFSLAIKNSKFTCKMSILWQMGQKDGNFLFWSMPVANNGNILRVYFKHPVTLVWSFMPIYFNGFYENSFKFRMSLVWDSQLSVVLKLDISFINEFEVGLKRYALKSKQHDKP